MRFIASCTLAALVALSVACGQLGYSSRVLHRVPSPDGQLLAVCQEIPEFDGPGYDVRVEDRGGRIRAHVFRGIDSDQCDEVVWSADGRALVVLTSYRAHVRIIDVPASLGLPRIDIARPFRHSFVTESAFSSGTSLKRGWDLRVVSRDAVELSVCTYDWERYTQTNQFDCTSRIQTERVAVRRSSSSAPG